MTSASARRTVNRSQPDLFGGATPRVKGKPQFDLQKLTKIALGIWRVSDDPRDAAVAGRWFASNGLELTSDIASNVVRFHASLKNGDARSPGLVWLLRDVSDDAPCSILRIYVDEGGNTISRKTLGRTYNAAIKLTADADVGTGLHIAPSVEQGIAALNSGRHSVWALPNAKLLADFPVIPGVKVLTIITDDADAPAVAAVSRRWTDAGREVIVKPP